MISLSNSLASCSTNMHQSIRILYFIFPLDQAGSHSPSQWFYLLKFKPKISTKRKEGFWWRRKKIFCGDMTCLFIQGTECGSHHASSHVHQWAANLLDVEWIEMMENRYGTLHLKTESSMKKRHFWPWPETMTSILDKSHVRTHNPLNGQGEGKLH